MLGSAAEVQKSATDAAQELMDSLFKPAEAMVEALDVFFSFPFTHTHIETLPLGESVCAVVRPTFLSSLSSRLKSSCVFCMRCARCERPLYSRLSDLCNPCAAAKTLEVELAEKWPEEKLRVIAGDIAVSAVRQVRALRLHRPSGTPETTSKAAASRPPLERRPERKRSRSRPAGKESLRREASASGERRREARKQASKTTEAVPEAPEVSSKAEARTSPAKPYSPSPETYSYYSNPEVKTENQEGETKTEERRELEEKGRRTPVRDSERSTGTRAHSPREKRTEKDKSAAPVIRGIQAAKTEAGTEEDKKRSKEEYLAQLHSSSTKVRLEENPRTKASERPRGNLLQIFDETKEKQADVKRRRKRTK